MPLFETNKTSVRKILSKKLDLEKTLQNLFEKNLEELLGIHFIVSEYSTSHWGRIDTLGIDKNGAPVIIEYKRGRNDNVINQGISYLKWLLDHKEKFENLVKKSLPSSKVPGEVSEFIDWGSPRILCIAENYSKFDLDTVEMLKIRIELYRYQLYEKNILQLELEEQRKIKIDGNPEKETTPKVGQQELNLDYSLDYHLEWRHRAIISMFEKLQEKILGLSENVLEEPKKLYIAYKLATNFVDVQIRSKDIKIFLNVPSGHLDDASNLALDLTKPKPKGHWWNGDYEVVITREEQIEEAFDLIVQAYEYGK